MDTHTHTHVQKNPNSSSLAPALVSPCEMGGTRALTEPPGTLEPLPLGSHTAGEKMGNQITSLATISSTDLANCHW